MQEVSDAYLEAVAYKSRQFYVRLKFTNLDYYITQKNIWSGSYVDAVDLNQILSMGNACAKKVELTLHSVTNLMVWKGAEFAMECGLKVPGEGIVWMPWGTFWVADTSTSNNHRTIKLTAYDRMYSMSKVAYATDLVAPFHYRDLLDEFLLKTGMTLSEDSYERLPDGEDAVYTINRWPDMDFSYSDIAAHLAGMIGCNARVSVADPSVLEFVWYTATNTIIQKTLYQDGLEKLADSELTIQYLVTGENSEIVIENTDGIDDGKIIFPEDPDDYLELAFTYDSETMTASVALAEGSESWTGDIVIPAYILYNGDTYAVTSIANNGFERAAFTSITLPETLQTIGSYAFSRSVAFTSIEFPEGLTTIGTYAFYLCTGLESAPFPASLATISSDAFRGCSSLQSINLDNVTYLGANVFTGCNSLTYVEVPATINGPDWLGYSTTAPFSECAGLITVVTYCTSIRHGMFQDCTALKNVYMHNATVINNGAFRGCTALEHITIPNTVTKMNANLGFADCTALKTVQVGTSSACSISSMGSNLFENCPALETITIYKSTDAVSGSPWGAENATVNWVG